MNKEQSTMTLSNLSWALNLDNVPTFQISSERDETNKQNNLFENTILYSTKEYYISRDVVMYQVSLILASTKFLCHFSSL